MYISNIDIKVNISAQQTRVNHNDMEDVVMDVQRQGMVDITSNSRMVTPNKPSNIVNQFR